MPAHSFLKPYFYNYNCSTRPASGCGFPLETDLDHRGERVAQAARQANAQQALLQHAAVLVEFQRGAVGQQRHLGGPPPQAAQTVSV